MTWVILALIVAAYLAGARAGHRAERRPCPLCAARAAQAQEIAELDDLFHQPAYGDD